MYLVFLCILILLGTDVSMYSFYDLFFKYIYYYSIMFFVL